MSGEDGTIQSELARFRAAVLATPALQDELGPLEDSDVFIPHAVARAAGLGIRLAPDDLAQALRPDPLGLARWSADPPTADCPPSGWLPIQVAPVNGQFCVDWSWFGTRSLREPFFEDSARWAWRQPLNRLVRHRTALSDLARCVAQQPALRPDGFIFHMSRCGSTLVSQMLAADPRAIVISEASPIDSVVRSDRVSPPEAGDVHAQLLATMIGALGRKRSAQQSRYFIKLDSWHTLSLPLFRRAFPSVPWVFLYREPADVLVSQMLERGIQTVPEYLPASLFGLTPKDGVSAEDYCAQVLGRTCEAVLAPFSQGGGLLVNYRQLPAALWTQILPHFGIASSEDEARGMAAVAEFDAKAPGLTFSAPSEFKKQLKTDALCATAERHMGAVYRALEALRLGT